MVAENPHFSILGIGEAVSKDILVPIGGIH